MPIPSEFIITDPSINKTAHYKKNIYGDYSVKIITNNVETLEVKTYKTAANDYDYCSSLWQDYVVIVEPLILLSTDRTRPNYFCYS